MQILKSIFYWVFLWLLFQAPSSNSNSLFFIGFALNFPFLAHYATVTSATTKLILKRPTTLDLKCKSKPRNGVGGSNSSKCKYMGNTTCLYHGPHRKTSSSTASKNWRTSDSSGKKSNIFVRLTSLSSRKADPPNHVVTSLTTSKSNNMKESPNPVNDHQIGMKNAFKI